MPVFVILCSILLISCSPDTGESGIDRGMLRAFAPLPDVMESAKNPVTAEKTALGRRLYHDPRLSRSQTISCATCHPLESYGVDGKRVSEGHQGLTGKRNSPTVYNAAGHFVQFWDGRAADVEEQAKGPVLNPVEMAMESGQAVEAVLRDDASYVEAFRSAFPDAAEPVTFDNMARAIGAFERTLVTPSRWDAFLGGDGNALSADEVAGFRKFTQTGCMTCHRGVYVGGGMYSRLGVVKGWPDKTDRGRFQVTGHERDRLLFKVPGLRNVAKTGPFLHDGSVESLEEMVRLMAEYQLGTELPERDVRLIVAWLGALTGDLNPE